MTVGGTTVSVGAGTAILTLPDVPSIMDLQSFAAGRALIRTIKFSEDFDDEIGWNVNGSITRAFGGNQALSLSGFWSEITSEHSERCIAQTNQGCLWYPLTDNPAANQANGVGPGRSISSYGQRQVDHWGVSLETQWHSMPDVMGVTQAPPRRTFAIGADIRGIDQVLSGDIALDQPLAGRGPVKYSEDLDTRYYGAYLAWGRDYTLPFLSSVTGGLGLQSSFLLRGGVYFAETEYEGQIIDQTTLGSNISSSQSLSDDETAYILGLVLQTRKPLGRRAMLSLKSEYEYYSYVPKMAYNTVDAPAIPVSAGRQNGTVLGDDDAFSMRTSLRLTIKLGPDSLYE